MNQDLKKKIEHIALTALGVGLAAVCTYLAQILKAYTG